MVKKWKMFPAWVLIVFVLTAISKVEAKKYIMTYLYGAGNYQEMLELRENNFNEISPSYFDITENGDLKLNYIDEKLVDAMKNKNIKVVPFLSNHWNREIGRKAVQNYEKLASQIADAIKENELDGINVDIENLTEKDRENYTNLVKKLREWIPENKIVAVSVAANPAGINVGWQGSYDYKEVAKYADYIMIMAYDEHYEGGASGPVASIDFVEKSLQYALSNVQKEKIVLGIPLYGRFWSVDTGEGGIGVSLQQIEKILKEYASDVIWDEISKTPKAIVNIKPTDALPKIGGRTLSPGKYEFWYENEESIEKKLNLIEKHDIKGVGMWKTGLETPGVWSIISEKMNKELDVRKEKFIDVHENYWAYEYINFISEKGVMIGKSKDKFNPEDSLTRAELATIIARFVKKTNIDITQIEERTRKLTDISGHWAAEEILELYNMGLIKGYENSEFRPDSSVTRAEASALVSRLLQNGKEMKEGNINLKYGDIPETHWAYSHIVELGEWGIIEGYENGNFEPEKNIKRSEIAKIICKIYENIV